MELFVLNHPGPGLASHDLWSAWNWELSILIPLSVTALIYLRGSLIVWRRAGPGHGIRWRNFMVFFGALMALILALISPLDELSNVLFSAHMTQHLVLILITAPLLVMSDFPLAVLWALPKLWSQALGRRWNQANFPYPVWRMLSKPVMAWLLFAITLWVWHAPIFYEAALRNETIHAIEHFGFLATAMLFWWVLLRTDGAEHVRYGIAVPYLFATALQSGILGALMTFTSKAWYPYYTDLVTPWGLTPLQDQQLAGVIMWLPGGAVFTLLTIGYFAAWLSAVEKRSISLQDKESATVRQEHE
jgi:putative membrane protein